MQKGRTAALPEQRNRTQPHPLTVDITSSGPETALGAHGGSGLSAIGGTIRLHEIEPDAPPIAHALKLELFARQYYFGGGASRRKLQPPSASNGGRTQYVWPATGSDACTWASCKPGSRCLAYNGTNEHLAPGALLALPAKVAAALRGSLRTEPGRRVADVLRDYGGYAVDDTASDSASLSWAAGAGDVFEKHYIMPLKAVGGPWYDELVKIFQALEIVTNNAPDAVGGGGKPRMTPLPPLCGAANLPLKTDDRDPQLARLLEPADGAVIFCARGGATPSFTWDAGAVPRAVDALPDVVRQFKTCL